MKSSILSLRHIGIVTRDMKTSLEFYKDFLGFEIKSDEIESEEYIEKMYGIRELALDIKKMKHPHFEAMIELIEYKNPQPNEVSEKNRDTGLDHRGMTHFALQVENADELYKRAQERGHTCINPPQVTPNAFAKVFFLKTPEGHYVECTEVLK